MKRLRTNSTDERTEKAKQSDEMAEQSNENYGRKFIRRYKEMNGLEVLSKFKQETQNILTEGFFEVLVKSNLYRVLNKANELKNATKTKKLRQLFDLSNDIMLVCIGEIFSKNQIARMLTMIETVIHSAFSAEDDNIECENSSNYEQAFSIIVSPNFKRVFLTDLCFHTLADLHLLQPDELKEVLNCIVLAKIPIIHKIIT